MSKKNELPSFPSMASGDSSKVAEVNEWEQENHDINVALNVSFLESLEEATKFSYVGLCADFLQQLYSSDREYCHEFITSFVAHLCLPSNVTNTMHAIADGHNQEVADVFIESLNQDKNIKEDPLLIVNDMVMWALINTNGCYDARTRVLIRRIASTLQVSYEDMECIEELMIEKLRQSSEKEKLEQETTRLKKARNRKWKRYGLIAVAAVGGGALVGLTGGLAAPLVAAGAGAVLGGASAAALGSVAGIAVITSLFGAAGAGLTGYKMKKRVGGIDEFLFKPLSSSNQPKITIAISGWLSDDKDDNFRYPWRYLDQSKEQYTLMWESKHLMRLGNAFAYILNSLMSVAATEALKFTVLAGIITAVAWPATIISAAGLIDNPWSVCLQRAVQVGRQLAEVLLAREHGHRPVTLIGYSLGGRVIYHCLEEMSKRKNHRGIIEDVYILGSPVTGDPSDWKKVGSVVAGHVTNAYCKTDWLLRFLYRTSSAQVKVAGLHPIMWDDRRMVNVDVSSIIKGHLDYASNMNEVLAAVGVRTTIGSSSLSVIPTTDDPKINSDVVQEFESSLQGDWVEVKRVSGEVESVSCKTETVQRKSDSEEATSISDEVESASCKTETVQRKSGSEDTTSTGEVESVSCKTETVQRKSGSEDTTSTGEVESVSCKTETVQRNSGSEDTTSISGEVESVSCKTETVQRKSDSEEATSISDEVESASCKTETVQRKSGSEDTTSTGEVESVSCITETVQRKSGSEDTTSISGEVESVSCITETVQRKPGSEDTTSTGEVESVSCITETVQSPNDSDNERKIGSDDTTSISGEVKSVFCQTETVQSKTDCINELKTTEDTSASGEICNSPKNSELITD